MSERLTEEQAAVVEAEGKLIVSASAGSGKTFVMIKKLANLLETADIDNVLAVTFTKKAAAQMKEKLRAALIERVNAAEGERRAHLKEQLSKISSANVSTIHSFCSHLLRTYFYALDFDGSFDIVSDDDSTAAALRKAALDSLFDGLYESDDGEFRHLLACYRRKRSDKALRDMVIEGYKGVKNAAGYREKLLKTEELFTPRGFERVCAEYHAFIAARCREMREEAKAFQSTLLVKNKKMYDGLFGEIYYALDTVEKCGDIFAEPPKLCSNKKKDLDEDKAEGERYKAFRKKLGEKYAELTKDLADRKTEEARFYASGKTAAAFSRLILKFDEEYKRVKLEEGKLDYADLEHYTLELLSDEKILAEIRSKFRYVYVDEYQDVNPVQERILSAIGGENVFLVGDVKQAIYGFRGSKSVFFSQKYSRFAGGEGKALNLSNNFRSSDGVLNFVNALFSQIMTEESCGTDYAAKGKMLRGGGYAEGEGFAKVHIFGKEEEAKEEALGVYSVLESAEKRPAPSREGLAVAEIVRRELGNFYYDLKEKKRKPVTPADICVLTRKKSNENVTGIVRALTDAGFSVSGAQDANICNRPEVKQMLDILSYIDNGEQDIPLAAALLSPLGSFNESELAEIRIAFKKSGQRRTFRECCRDYPKTGRKEIADKLAAFNAKVEEYRNFAELFGAASLIDKILEDTCREAQYMRGGGRKLKNIRRLRAEAVSSGELSLSAFLERVKAGGYDIPAPDGSSSDSIKVMTMHSSKGLEFPIVILADICRTFRGRDAAELALDDDYGFVPKYYDAENLIKADTLLCKLAKLRARREEFKNEANLYYVACTRAMYGLHVLAEEEGEYSPYDLLSAKSYAEMTDLKAFGPEIMEPCDGESAPPEGQILISDPDENVRKSIDEKFARPYDYESSVNLPVKSSASAILRAQNEEYYATNELFPEEDEEYGAQGGDRTSAEAGIAYHRFLQLCDFSRNDLASVEKQLAEFLESGRITEEQRALLSAEKLVKILSMPVFQKAYGAKLFREQEFLCRLPANEFLDTEATDGVLIQGAIDLLAVRGDECAIIDYKYSKMGPETLLHTYAKQLALYKKAVSVILKKEEKQISTTIVNIFSCTEIPVVL